eukprot:s2688_g12.t1
MLPNTVKVELDRLGPSSSKGTFTSPPFPLPVSRGIMQEALHFPGGSRFCSAAADPGTSLTLITHDSRVCEHEAPRKVMKVKR